MSVVALTLLAGACGRSAPDESEVLQGSTASPSTVPSPTTAPTTAPVITTAPPSTNPPAYVVQQGDSLSVIAQRFGVELDALADFNGITDVNAIKVGQSIAIPPPTPETSSTTAAG